MLGRTTHCLAGVPTIEEQFCGIKLALSSTTFVQVNTPQAERIVQRLTDWLLTQCAGARVVDAYCGVGTIALPLARPVLMFKVWNSTPTRWSRPG